ncbi:MAG: hypothetical protein WBP03_04005 [Candidatus Saccharimonadales bacterium]
MNQWIQFVSKTDAAFADPFSMAGKINQTQGEFLVGDYPSTTRKGLLDLYRDTKVFTPGGCCMGAGS